MKLQRVFGLEWAIVFTILFCGACATTKVRKLDKYGHASIVEHSFAWMGGDSTEKCQEAEEVLAAQLSDRYGEDWHEIVAENWHDVEDLYLGETRIDKYGKRFRCGTWGGSYIVKNIMPEIYEAEDRRRHNPLLPAVRKGKIDEVKALIAGGAEVDRKNLLGYSALIVAVQSGNLEMVDYLIRAGANVNLIDDEGDSALHWAVRDQVGLPLDARIVSRLLAAGANPNIIGRYGTPLHRLCDTSNGLSDQRKKAVAAILKTKPDLTLVDRSGYTVLDECGYQATLYGEVEIFKWVLVATGGGGATAKGNERIEDLIKKRELEEYREEKRAKAKDFCLQWAAQMPIVATPRRGVDRSQACSNLWSVGSKDHTDCMQTWVDCDKYYKKH